MSQRPSPAPGGSGALGGRPAAAAAAAAGIVPSEALLAQLLTQRALSLQQRSEAEGVTAFLRRPVVRGRLNERFLQVRGTGVG